MWQFIPTSSLLILSAAVSFALAFVTWRMKPERSFTWIMILICAGIWATGSALETFVVDLGTKVRLITTIPYLGITGVIYFWSLFTIIYSQHEQWLNKWTMALLAVMPVTTYLLVLTGTAHPYIWESYWLVERNGYAYFDQAYGIGFWIWAVYAYLVILVGALLIITAVIRFPRLYQGQAVMLILGVLIPLISNVLYLTGLNPIAPLDLSPVSLTLTGILITIGLLRFRLFNLVPIAHDLVFKAVTNGVIILDLKGQIVDLNPAAEQVLNRRRDELVGQTGLTALPEYAELIRQFKNVWETKTEIALGSDQRIYELQIMPLTNRRQKAVGRVILLYDITERRAALGERDRLISELDAYARTVAHDLKNPLSLIVGYSKLMQRKEKETLSASAQASLNVIAQTGDKMTEIIDSMLLLANVRSQNELELKPLDTAVLVHRTWTRLEQSLAIAGAELMAPVDWPTAVGYAPWIEQVWANLLSNALKYGGRPPLVTAGAERMAGDENGAQPWIRFWVSDNGPGLTAAEIGQIFQQFARLDQHHNLDGHGLGLSIVQRIVERAGGQVGVESEPGRGSTFFFTLPATPSPPLKHSLPQTVNQA